MDKINLFCMINLVANLLILCYKVIVMGVLGGLKDFSSYTFSFNYYYYYWFFGGGG